MSIPTKLTGYGTEDRILPIGGRSTGRLHAARCAYWQAVCAAYSGPPGAITDEQQQAIAEAGAHFRAVLWEAVCPFQPN